MVGVNRNIFGVDSIILQNSLNEPVVAVSQLRTELMTGGFGERLTLSCHISISLCARAVQTAASYNSVTTQTPAALWNCPDR